MKINPEIKSGLFVEDIDVYHATKAIGSTHLRTFMKSPKKFWHLWNNGYDNVESEALRIGSAVHCNVLEPDEFNKRFIKEPELNKRTKKGREEAQKFQEKNKEMTVLPIKEWDIVQNCTSGILNDKNAFSLLKGTQREMSARVKLSNGLCVQCRPDAIKGNYIIDLKTCVDLSRFNYDLKSNRYHIQAAFYYFILSSIFPHVYQDSDFYFIAIEKSEPFETKIYALSNENLIYLVEEEIKPTLISLSNFLLTGPSSNEIEWIDVL